MAKRRRRSSSPKKKSGNWKKSKGLAIALIGAIVIIWGILISRMVSSSPATFTNFPYTYITEDEDAKPIVKKRDSNKRIRAPFKENGKWYWNAYQCNNPKCPGRSKDGKPFIFPYVIPWVKKRIEENKSPYPTPKERMEMEKSGHPMMEMEMIGQDPRCPACESEKLESFNVQPFLTPEGKKIREEYRKKMEAEHNAKSGGKKKRHRK